MRPEMAGQDSCGSSFDAISPLRNPDKADDADTIGNVRAAAAPNGHTSVELGPLRATVAVARDSVNLRVEHEGLPLLHEVRLGVTVAGLNLGCGSELIRVGHHDVADEWTARSGKAAGVCRYRHVEKVLHLRHSSGVEWQVRVRIGHAGVAVRYAMERLQGLSRLETDGTRIELPRTGRAWVLDYQTWYETPRRGIDIADLPAGDYGFPLLARLGTGTDRHLLVTESGIDGRYCGAHAHIEPDGALTFALADPAVEIARGDVTPWRVFLLGTLAEIVESRFVDELAPPASAEMANATWIRPGRAAWSWWSDFYSGAQLELQKHFIDVAAQFGWEHLLIDCGWEETWVPEIVAYASLRGIQVHLWTVWHDLDGSARLDRLALWRSWGVAGIKVDFMESEAKDRYRWYDGVLAESARVGLMINFHGSVIPRGWARTWPHVISYEAIRAAEYYVFGDDTPPTAEHNVVQPFTRNVVGAMDYTPVAFTAPGRTTSDGHELALAVAFECGITHFADSVDAYVERPSAVRMLQELPATWDETLLLGGSPDTEAVIARRSGDRWFVAAIATGSARTLRVPLNRLSLPPARAWIVTDAAPASGTGLREVTTDVDADGVLEIPIATNGGFLAILAGQGAELLRATPRATSAAPVIDPALAELDETGQAVLQVAANASLRLPPGWTAQVLGDGRWQVRAHSSMRPGSLGVVTVEEPGDDPRVPRIAHARLVLPLRPGTYRLSELPLLSFTNESGPVERDMSNGGGNPADGSRMRIAGVEYDDGFGVSSPSSLKVFLGGRTQRLDLAVGVDDETPGTRARALVYGEGTKLADIEIRAGQPAVATSIDVSGIRVLTLATEPGAPGEPPAHVDWASARIRAPDACVRPETSQHPLPNR